VAHKAAGRPASAFFVIGMTPPFHRINPMVLTFFNIALFKIQAPETFAPLRNTHFGDTISARFLLELFDHEFRAE
jgi:hypothetical protein